MFHEGDRLIWGKSVQGCTHPIPVTFIERKGAWCMVRDDNGVSHRVKGHNLFTRRDSVVSQFWHHMIDQTWPKVEVR